MKKKNIAGLLVMVVLLAAALPLGVNRSLNSLREEAASSYNYDKAGYAIYAGIEAREEAASNLLTVAKKYTSEEPDLVKLVDDLETKVTISRNTYDDVEEEAAANQEMGEAAQALFEKLETMQLSEKDAKYPKQMIAQMDSEQDKIQRSSYNDDAREFNARLDKFPVNYLRHAAFVEPLGLFE